ncbi:MAG TPA: AsmA-like C-terminal region-containing protein [Verrucomicrobiae bacterium]|nr:AsmA-like C-terminal region-containing protein [Verrucomicrobiae bacterium]
MKPLKLILMIVAGLAAVVIVLAGAGLYVANRYVQSPAFEERLLATAREELGADVRLAEFHPSLFSGVTLRGVTIGNPTNFPGNLVTADSFVLRYRLLPLLRRRVEIERLSLDKPVITLLQNDTGQWNYEGIGAKESAPKPQAAKPLAETAPAVKSETAVPFDVVLSKLAITHGAVSLVGEGSKPLVNIDGLDFASSLSFTGNKLGGTGHASLDKVAVAESLFVRKLAAPVLLTTNQIKLAPLSGKIADGTVTGDATLELLPAFKYAANVQVAGGDVAKLLAEAGRKQVITGKLEMAVSLEGTGGLPTIAGHGHAKITDGQLMQFPVLNLVASLLQIDELRNLKFSECSVEFVVTNNVMETPAIRLVSPQVQITGNGAVALNDYSLNHNLTIAFAPGALSHVPKEIRNLFTQRQDGSLALDFRVWGPYNAPKTDLQNRLVKGAAEQLLEKGLQKFLK